MPFGDLPVLRAGSGEDERDYDFARRIEHVNHHGLTALKYLYKVLEIDCAEKLTNHTARPHSERDLRRLPAAQLKGRKLRPPPCACAALSSNSPTTISSFKDRYTRQSRRKPCSTIVAHLSKDGLMFIHPTQNRSLTPREAARLADLPGLVPVPRQPHPRLPAHRQRRPAPRGRSRGPGSARIPGTNGSSTCC